MISVDPVPLDPVDRRYRRVGRRQHRVDDDHRPLGDVGRHLVVVLDRPQRGRVAVEADMADAGRGHQVEHAVEQAVAGAQDRDQADLLAGEQRRLHRLAAASRSRRGQRQVAGDLVADQQRHLAHEPAELGHGRLLHPHQGQLVLDQRMIDHDEVGHAEPPLCSRREAGLKERHGTGNRGPRRPRDEGRRCATRVKICCIETPEAAALAIRHGADALGLVGPMPSGTGIIDLDTAAPDRARRAAAGRDLPAQLGHRRPKSSWRSAAQVAPTVLQIVDAVDPAAYALLRRELPALKLVQVVHVTGEQTIAEALAIATQVDALLLDSGSPDAPVRLLGGTGRVHDWSISRKIVDGLAGAGDPRGRPDAGQRGRGDRAACGRSGSTCAPACAREGSSTRANSRPSCRRWRPPETTHDPASRRSDGYCTVGRTVEQPLNLLLAIVVVRRGANDSWQGRAVASSRVLEGSTC